MFVDHIFEAHIMPEPELYPASIMDINEMLKHGYMLGKCLAMSLQGKYDHVTTLMLLV